MTTIQITDTLESFKMLAANGFTDEQAEAIIQTVGTLNTSQLATKQDLRETEKRLGQKILANQQDLQETEKSLRQEIQDTEKSLRQDLQETEKSLRQEIQDVKTDLTKLIYINTLTTIGILTAVISIAVAIIRF